MRSHFQVNSHENVKLKKVHYNANRPLCSNAMQRSIKIHKDSVTHFDEKKIAGFKKDRGNLENAVGYLFSVQFEFVHWFR